MRSIGLQIHAGTIRIQIYMGKIWDQARDYRVIQGELPFRVSQAEVSRPTWLPGLRHQKLECCVFVFSPYLLFFDHYSPMNLLRFCRNRVFELVIKQKNALRDLKARSPLCMFIQHKISVI